MQANNRNRWGCSKLLALIGSLALAASASAADVNRGAVTGKPRIKPAANIKPVEGAPKPTCDGLCTNENLSELGVKNRSNGPRSNGSDASATERGAKGDTGATGGSGKPTNQDLKLPTEDPNCFKMGGCNSPPPQTGQSGGSNGGASGGPIIKDDDANSRKSSANNITPTRPEPVTEKDARKLAKEVNDTIKQGGQTQSIGK